MSDIQKSRLSDPAVKGGSERDRGPESRPRKTALVSAIVETGRLYARHFVPADLDEFAGLCADAEVMRFMGDGTTLPRETVARWIDVCHTKYETRGYGTSAVFVKASGNEPERFAGYCGVVRAPDSDFDEIVYAYHKREWGKGFATEMGRAMLAYVFGRSALDAIWSTIHPENKVSIATAAKLGFSFIREVIDETDGMPTAYFKLSRTDFEAGAGHQGPADGV